MSQDLYLEWLQDSPHLYRDCPLSYLTLKSVILNSKDQLNKTLEKPSKSYLEYLGASLFEVQGYIRYIQELLSYYHDSILYLKPPEDLNKTRIIVATSMNTSGEAQVSSQFRPNQKFAGVYPEFELILIGWGVGVESGMHDHNNQK